MTDRYYDSPYPSFKISMSSVVESDRELFNRKSSKFYKIILILIISDFVLTEYIFIHDYFLKTNITLNLFLIFSLITLIFFISLIILLYLKKILLSKIARFCYLVIGICFFVFEVIIRMMKLSNRDFDMDFYDYILFIALAFSIIPRITGFLYIRIFERAIKKMDEAKRAEEHEMFKEKVYNKLDSSTAGNRNLEKEIEKELEKDDEEIIFKYKDEKLTGDKIENNKNESGEKKEEEAN